MLSRPGESPSSGSTVNPRAVTHAEHAPATACAFLSGGHRSRSELVWFAMHDYDGSGGSLSCGVRTTRCRSGQEPRAFAAKTLGE